MKDIFFQFLNCLFCWLFCLRLLFPLLSPVEDLICSAKCIVLATLEIQIQLAANFYSMDRHMMCKVLGTIIQPCFIQGAITRKMNSCVSVSKHVSISGNLPRSFMQTNLMDFTGMLLERPMTAKNWPSWCLGIAPQPSEHFKCGCKTALR